MRYEGAAAKSGPRWRGLTPGRQALLVRAHLRTGETYADFAAGFGVGTTTAFRYIQEALVQRAPSAVVSP